MCIARSAGEGNAAEPPTDEQWLRVRVIVDLHGSRDVRELMDKLVERSDDYIDERKFRNPDDQLLDSVERAIVASCRQSVDDAYFALLDAMRRDM